MSTYLIALLSILLSVAAQFALKAGMSSPSVKPVLAADPWTPAGLLSVALNPYVMAGFALYGVGAIVWLAVLSKWEVSKAYPFVGLGFVVTLVVGMLLGEQVSSGRAIGVALVVAGVVLVGRS